MKTVFEYKDYKKYLADLENSGLYKSFRSQLAKSAPCQNAYVSQVLNGSQHFNLEQLDGISDFLSISKDEKEHFFLLLQLARAGTPSLRKFFSEQIQRSVERHLSLHNRVPKGQELNHDDQITYYSEWYFSAIHVLVTIEKFATIEAIVERLKLPLSTVKSAVEFLLSSGLLIEKKGILGTGQARLHLSGDSPLTSRHHANWRLQTLQHFPKRTVSDLHYTSVATLSEKDSEAIREILIKAIQESKDVIRDSREENIFSLHVDFYKL